MAAFSDNYIRFVCLFVWFLSNYFTDIIRQFSPSVKGASAKVSQDDDDFVDDLNVAFIGASARYM